MPGNFRSESERISKYQIYITEIEMFLFLASLLLTSAIYSKTYFQKPHQPN